MKKGILHATAKICSPGTGDGHKTRFEGEIFP
jgi:hypothetical protein